MEVNCYETILDELEEFIDKELSKYSSVEDSSLFARAICQELRVIQEKIKELYYTFTFDPNLVQDIDVAFLLGFWPTKRGGNT